MHQDCSLGFRCFKCLHRLLDWGLPMENDFSICSLHAELIYVLSILRKQSQVQLIHLPVESSALPAEALVINDRAVVSTQAGWAARATIHFPSSSRSADCCTEKWDVPSKLTLAFIPAWTQLCLTSQGPSGHPAGDTNQEKLRSTHRAEVCVPPERLIQ